MSDGLSEIWADDRLGRQVEAHMIETHINEELYRRAQAGGNESYVLAIDAPYGQGKSWFLEHMRLHLAKKHPVAFVDAWIDDASEEPLVAIMAAIQDVLEPYISVNSKLSKSFKAASRSALPIIGKGITGGASKLAQKFLGDAILEEVGDEFKRALDIDESDLELVGDVLDTAVEKSNEAVSALIDRHAEEMIAAYRRRQDSRTMFKKNMTSLVASISSETASVSAPFFVIVDELDRCRPDYAIRLLEEIKHIFDVPGVVFFDRSTW